MAFQKLIWNSFYKIGITQMPWSNKDAIKNLKIIPFVDTCARMLYQSCTKLIR